MTDSPANDTRSATFDSRVEGILARRGWAPSRNAVISALDVVEHVDIPIHITRYTVVCAERHKQPSSPEWLRYILADEVVAKEKLALAQRQTREKRSWYDVAD